MPKVRLNKGQKELLDAALKDGDIEYLKDFHRSIQDVLDEGEMGISEPALKYYDKAAEAIQEHSGDGEPPPPAPPAPPPAPPPTGEITQAHYLVTSSTSSAGALSTVIKLVASRLRSYVDSEDATAEFTIFIEGGASRSSISSSGTVIKAKVNDRISSDKLIKLLAPYIVAMYDQQDSDYDEDITSFLIDIMMV